MNQLDALFAFNQQALNLRAHRSQVLASNVANADTPGYQARDFDFAQALNQAIGKPSAGPGALTATSPNHLQGTPTGETLPGGTPLLYRKVTQASVDNNTVDMDVERAQFADNAIHYEANLMFITGQIKTMLAALQG
jgi:flagellar basal-body rod protein FlgB